MLVSDPRAQPVRPGCEIEADGLAVHYASNDHPIEHHLVSGKAITIRRLRPPDHKRRGCVGHRPILLDAPGRGDRVSRAEAQQPRTPSGRGLTVLSDAIVSPATGSPLVRRTTTLYDRPACGTPSFSVS